MLIRYQGFRPAHRDNLYQTGEWKSGDVKDVPEDIAAKLLRHPDVFRRAKNGAEPTEKVEPPQSAALEDIEAARMQDIRYQVGNMTEKQAVIDFAQANFGRKLSSKLGLEKLKLEAVRLIDLYGLP